MKRFFSEFKPLYHIPVIGCFIGVVLGFPIFQNPIGAIFAGGTVGTLFGLMIGMFAQNNDQLERLNLSDFKNDINFLVHYYLTETGQLGQREYDFFLRSITRNFDASLAEQALQHLKSIEDENYNIRKIYRHIIENYSFKNKKQVFLIIIGLALSDRYLTQKEEDLLYDIGDHLRFPEQTIFKILSIYNYTTEQEHKSRSRSRKKYDSFSFSKEQQCLEVLHLEIGSTKDDIKKSYRTLVKKYHPDRLIKASPLEKQIAEEEFLRIQEAYEYLKEKMHFT